MDVYADYIALGGNLVDPSYTGSSTMGLSYVAVSSIANSATLYWAKVHTSRIGAIAALQFSTDGTLLIGHSKFPPTFIIVFNSATGAVVSTRGYSGNSN